MYPDYEFTFEYEPAVGEFNIQGTATLKDAGADSDHMFNVQLLDDIILDGHTDLRFAHAHERAFNRALKEYVRARILVDPHADQEWGAHLEEHGWRPGDQNAEHRTDNRALAGTTA